MGQILFSWWLKSIIRLPLLGVDQNFVFRGVYLHYNKYKKQLNKIEDEVGVAVPKSTQIRFNFVGITYHIHYTSLRLLFSIISCTSDSVCKALLYFDIDSMHVGS